MAASKAFTPEPPKATDSDVDEIVISDEAAKDAKGTKKKFVRYVGEATRRVITKADWAKAGFEGVETTEWSIANDQALASEDFTDAQIDYLLKTDGRFKATDR